MSDHFEVTGRGAFIIGHIRDGVVSIGDKLPVENTSAVYTICGVESVDNLRERNYWTALVFEEQPALFDIQAAFPVGSCVDICEGEQRE